MLSRRHHQPHSGKRMTCPGLLHVDTRPNALPIVGVDISSASGVVFTNDLRELRGVLNS